MSHDKPTATRGQTSDLFGRGTDFVVVWAMQMVVATVVSPVLAHVLPIFEFGKLASAIALYQMLIVLAVFGLDQALEMQRARIRSTPGGREDSWRPACSSPSSWLLAPG